MKYIQLKSKQHFKEVMLQYNKVHKDWLWNTFRELTYYLPSKDCFINLEKAEKL